jgi:methionyl-tRNA formyltransferase
MRILFMGNPEFAVASLQKIHEAGHEIAAVVTGMDKPAGRGLKLKSSPVKEYALQHGLKILQPEKLRSPEFLEEIKSLEPELGVVIAFRMLPEVVWAMPRLGTINLHASLLPQYRGAAPINWAIINGEKQTGLTTFFLKHEIDTGNIIMNQEVPVYEEDDAGTLHDRMMVAGAGLVLKTIEAISTKNYKEHPQPPQGELKKAPKIFKQDCLLEFNHATENIYNRIRGLSPYPGAYCIMNDMSLKIFKAGKIFQDSHPAPGTFIRDGSTLKVSTSDGFIELLEVQPEGKKRMGIREFLNGYTRVIGNGDQDR